MLKMYIAVAIIYFITVSLVDANVPRTGVTVSGVSSGAAMANQLHIAFSNDISGAGVLAGPPYYCAGGLLSAAACMSGPVTSISVSGITKKIKAFESSGLIDSTANIVNDPVYIFSGKYDPVALPGMVKLNEKVYASLNANMKTNYDLPATHAVPTEHYGGKCAIPNLSTYINNCNFSLAYDVLNHLLGGDLIKPPYLPLTPRIGQLVVFNQEAFMNPPSSLSSKNPNTDASFAQWIWKNMVLYNPRNWGSPTSGISNWTIPSTTISMNKRSLLTRANPAYGFDSEGFVYFPSACAQGRKCPIHVALHGCKQGKHYVGDIFVTQSGYLEVAELNNVIILTSSSSVVTFSDKSYGMLGLVWMYFKRFCQ
ncbi:hypothetical protein I4U23_000365 [Adineta vaga]|nr:hypothetical protein I4U23_000365 [Adineta vaga]